MLVGMSEKQTVSIDGHRLTLTNLDKVMYPSTGTTKRDVMRYYAEIADVLIPLAADRPVTRKRWVNGVGTETKPGESFFQKNLDDSTPEWVARRTMEHKQHSNEYPLLNDRATLAWLAQIAALELHVPQWRFGPRGGIRNPDRLVLDLDPGEGVGLAECAEVARLAHSILTDMGLDAVPVTSGSKGIHLYSALDGSQSDARVSELAHELARALEADHPDLVVSEMKKSRRAGKVFVDWSQNSRAKTTVTPYSLRGRLRPTVAAPRTWRELKSADLAQLEYGEVLRRSKRRRDPMAALAAADGDRLQRYRSKRDAQKTPEPMPKRQRASSRGSSPGHGASFVIQEHHARSLHWDFRLEHDGVLVSWALPKGVPTSTGSNRLAVQTEDHPLEYRDFEGHIPKGEYGGGDVTIWDDGYYESEKWRDGEEIVVTLHGRDDGPLGGPTKLALIHTGGDGKNAQNWLMHLMTDPSSGTSETPDSTATTETTAPPASGSRAPRPVSPMLATLGSAEDIPAEDERDWAYEMKWDGIRMLAAVGVDGVRLVTRNGNDVTATYPEVADALPQAVTGQALLDGEVVAVDRAGRPDFGLLQTRMGLTRAKEVAAAAAKAPVQYLVFDLIERDGRRLVRQDYDERRRMLAETVRERGAIRVPPAFDGDLAGAMATSRDLRLEGVVAKKRDGTYRAGRRSRSWIKIKHHRTQEVIVVGWRPGKGRRSGGVGSLLVAIHEDGALRYIGRVGTGFTDRDLDDIARRMRSRHRATPPLSGVPRPDAADARWVRADLVGEVEFAEWTTDGRLRQPSWRGWRPDKSADEVTAES